ncbi:hypothetical protein F5Y04DRAFT_287512 [Hypomontagnella monticulosa]|nr:hypothetical protein F5Y04DRAFT_287512 [Hypomontagnella monticulosa]
MVTPACYPPSDAGRRYSRACPPYPIHYTDRRYHLSSQDGARTTTMTERECGRCRKRKIRCSGDPGNGLPCSNCKNAGHEPCLFLRVSSTETHLKSDGNDFGYNLEAARPYSNQGRVAVTQVNSMSQYPADISNGDVINSYRQSQYQYGNKSYYSTVPTWAGAYTDDNVDYGINYSYPMLSQDSASMVQSYGRYGSGKSVYVDPENSSYSYSNLVHRPAVSSESPTGFSLSGMAASLPNPSDRVASSDRLLTQVNRTLTGSSSFRADGLPSYSGTKTSPTSSMPEVGYSSLNSSFDQSYSSQSTLSSNTPNRSVSQHDGATYHSSVTPASDGLYASSDQSLRSGEDANSTLSYIYSDKLDGSRRDSQSSGGASTASVLPNGHVYVPDSHHSHVSSSQNYVPPSQGSAVDGATAPSGRGSGSSSSGTSHMHTTTDGHRRSAGNLRGG